MFPSVALIVCSAIACPILDGCSSTPHAVDPLPEKPRQIDPLRTGEGAVGTKEQNTAPSMTNHDVASGELPWWFELHPGVYTKNGEAFVFAAGDSRDYHHIAEGYLHAKVNARLGVLHASEIIRFNAVQPEPALEDLFITRDHHVYALYALRLPKSLSLPELASISMPREIQSEGRRRIGRHVYEGNRHLFLECEVEGPIANPDWGRARAAARN